MISRIRLSPSGAFIGNPPLEVGSDPGAYAGGSAGLVWRQLGGTATVDIQNATAVEILSSMASDGFYIPVGFRYELIAKLVHTANATPATFDLGFERSVDNGVTWASVASLAGAGVTGLTTLTMTPPASCDSTWMINCVRYNATAEVLAVGAPGIRIRVVGRSTSAAAPHCTVKHVYLQVTQWAN